MTYKVVAVWPDGVLPRHSGNVTTDNFTWRWQARNFLRACKVWGWGNESEVKPERIWIEFKGVEI